MTKTLEQTIIEELRKTGYPVEISCANVMKQRGWGAVHNPSYLDSNDSREIDIRAYRSMEAGGIRVGYYLLTECKRSDKPWVFFVTPEARYGSRLGDLVKGHLAGKQVLTSQGGSEALISDVQLRGFHHYFQLGKLARTFYEPLKGQERANHTQMIYSAAMSSVKATLFHWKDDPIKSHCHVFYPVIVFGGDLFEAEVGDDREISLTRVQHVQLSFYYIYHTADQAKPARDGSYTFIVDVVQEGYLPTFLSIIEEEQRAFSVFLTSALSKGA